MEIGADQMIRSRLRGRVGAVRRVRSGFGKLRVCRTKRSEDLIGRNVEKAEIFLPLVLQCVPVVACCFQQRESADDIGLHELRWAMDRAVDMAFGGKMHDCARFMLLNQSVNRFTITNIHSCKDVARIVFEAGQRLQIASVGQFVDIYDRLLILRKPFENEICADESCAASN
ncbi:hypothetical protein D9M70_430380 [compost metagenome]